jgi:hypothetical protein
MFFSFSGGSSSSRKSVRFSEVVHRQVFRSNSSILGQKMKNIKKAEQKKRRAIERRASEGDAEHFASSSGDGVHKAGSWMNVRYGGKDDDDDDSHTDSGMASSMEEASQIPKQKKSLPQTGAMKSGTRKGNKEQAKSSQQLQTKKKPNSGQFLTEANSDLIFDLDF